jgi:hypothetical protein
LPLQKFTSKPYQVIKFTLLTNAYKGRKDGRKLTAKQTAKVNDILYKSLVLDMTTREVSQQPREVQEVAQQVLSGERQ